MASHDASVLFVCLGNICRSPLAEGVMRHAVAGRGLGERIQIDSCGTGAWHVGESPDLRSVEVAAAHGIDISGQRARQLHPDDFQRFDWVVAMDRDNGRVIRQRAPRQARARIVQFMDYVPGASEADVPDPYYGGPGGFEHVYGLLAAGAPPLLDAVVAAMTAR
jgi:protein-tyrosine phosphatase